MQIGCAKAKFRFLWVLRAIFYIISITVIPVENSVKTSVFCTKNLLSPLFSSVFTHFHINVIINFVA